MLDGIDGRVARMIKGQSKFGAELDSLADFVNFGVAPGLILYFWQLHELHNGGWIAAMVFAISGGLRLARFNATMDDPEQAAFAANFFTGVPAPAGAITALLPIYLAFLGVSAAGDADGALYAADRLPDGVAAAGVLRQDRAHARAAGTGAAGVRRVIFFIALLIGYPWHILSVGSVLYLLSLPLGWKSYRDHKRAYDAANAPRQRRRRACARAGASSRPRPSLRTTTGPTAALKALVSHSRRYAEHEPGISRFRVRMPRIVPACVPQWLHELGSGRTRL